MKLIFEFLSPIVNELFYTRRTGWVPKTWTIRAIALLLWSGIALQVYFSKLIIPRQMIESFIDNFIVLFEPGAFFVFSQYFSNTDTPVVIT